MPDLVLSREASRFETKRGGCAVVDCAGQYIQYASRWYERFRLEFWELV